MYLNCKTAFSFRYGVLKTEELVAEAVQQGAQALALTNINCTADHWEFYRLCKEQNIAPVLGVEIRNGVHLLYLVLARNLKGLQAINAFLSHHLQEKIPFPQNCPLSEEVWVIYPLSRAAEAREEHELVGIMPSEVTKLYSLRHLHSRCVVRQPVTFRDKKGYNLHRLLRAIDKNILLSLQKAEELAGTGETFIPAAQMFSAFGMYPQILTNTMRVMESCHYEIDLQSDKTKKHYSASAADDRVLLKKLAMEGLVNRYGKNNKEAAARVQKELGIIHDLGFDAYFLITWDIIRYARNRGFYYVGRGSGGNSIVAYCLGITDVNPVDLDLYFERFLNPYRSSPPDFDIDFSWKDRDEVIDYVFKRYGKEHVALLGMYSTFKRRAAIRELGKVFGLPKGEIDALCNDARATLTEDNIQKQILFYGTMMKGLPNHLSVHPGGMLISEAPITQYTAIEMPPKGFATSQIDMFTAEDIGLYKLDILSQRGLGHIRETVSLVRENKGVNLDITRVEEFMKDAKVADQIRSADTIGCFYIESPAMRQLLKKLHCDDYITLVAASSIIRPGVAQSGMMKQYIYYYHHPDEVKYIHPKMKELLEETYGVMVYQEDVIKVAHHFAGLDMGEADVLRRAMSGKYRGSSGFERIRNKFFSNCRELGYEERITAEVWRQIESFGGYSFSKAHSASFAVESYQSLFLKTYYPLEFMVAVINNFGGFYSTELYFNELKRAGGKLHPPCVNRSGELTHIEGEDVYLGFIHVHGLEKATIAAILREQEAGPFYSLDDFIRRTAVGLEQLVLLIRAGSLRFIGKDKKPLLWEAHFIHKKIVAERTSPASLFQETVKTLAIPELQQEEFEDVMDEIELFGFPLRDAFHLVDADPSAYLGAADFPEHKGKTVEVLGYFITSKPVQTIKGDYMYFGTFLDSRGDWVDSVHFPQVAEKYMLQGNGFYLIRGKVVEEFDVYSLEVEKMKKIGVKLSTEYKVPST